MYTFGFILEQTLGHRTHTQNLQRNVTGAGSVSPQWGLVAWETNGFATRLPLYRSNWTVRASLRARRAIAAMNRNHKLDALFIHTQVPAVLTADWVRRIPTVISLDATPLQYDTLGAHYDHEQQAGWVERIKWHVNRYSLTQARHLVTWSAWTKASLIHDYALPASRITIIPPGVNLALWPVATPRPRQDAAVRILFVGGDFRRKGGDRLLKAFRGLRQQLPPEQAVELHLVTRDQLPAEAGVTVYNDLQPNSDRLRALFQRCDLFCLPSAGDCLPLVLAEAGATGLPLIATAVGAISEIVRDGETGLLIPPADDAALAAALQRLVSDAALRTRLGANAAALIRTEHDAERNTHQLLDLLKAVADTATSMATPHRHQAGTLSPAEEGQVYDG